MLRTMLLLALLAAAVAVPAMPAGATGAEACAASPTLQCLSAGDPTTSALGCTSLAVTEPVNVSVAACV
jgi:hypothetical protein